MKTKDFFVKENNSLLLYFEKDQSEKGILGEAFQKRFLTAVDMVPLNYRDSLIRSLVSILPLDIPGSPRNPFGWDYFMRKIPKFTGKGLEALDLTVAYQILGILYQY